MGYAGSVGLEYKPRGSMDEALAWLPRAARLIGTEMLNHPDLSRGPIQAKTTVHITFFWRLGARGES